MPHFEWRGATLEGAVKTGKLFARSQHDLEVRLLRQDIGLISSKEARARLISPAIRLEDKLSFFRQLAQLLNAGLLLPEALTLVVEHVYNPSLQTVAISWERMVQQGIPCAQAFSQHPKIFDSLTIQMVHVGQETGSLALCLTLIADHLEAVHDVRKKLVTALMVPTLSFAFFCVIAVLITCFVLPRFADIFSGLGKELPTTTRLLMNASTILLSWYKLIGVMIVVFMVSGWRFCTSTYGLMCLEKALLAVPVFGSAVKTTNAFYFCRALGLLLRGGFDIPQALRVAQSSITCSVLRAHCAQVADEVAAGNSISQTLMYRTHGLFESDIVALIKTGEDSGQLALMLERAAALYKERITRKLQLLTVVIQPVCVIMLGLLIMLLMTATYMPMLQMGNLTF